ncbi:ABC transporter permease [Paraburkholderia fungorum]|uniref:ABC transporter permease n=1 Tax=Paraburkholderia fungorum TaxID=134537 RepID=UPI00402B4C55
MRVISMAWRNLWRNRRRSLVTLSSIAFGVAAVGIFSGYTSSVYRALANASVHAEMLGHFTVTRNGWYTRGKIDPQKYLLTAGEITRVREIATRQLPGVLIAPRMSVSGLLSNGHTSTVFVAEGIAPDDLERLLGPFYSSRIQLDPARPDRVAVAEGLADMLGLKEDDGASVLVSTIHGQANAQDVELHTVFNTGNLSTNDKFMVFPLSSARSLMDAPDRAERLTLLLASADGGNGVSGNSQVQPPPDETTSARIRAQLSQAFAAAGLDVKVRTWQEMSSFYRQVKTMYDLIFALMLSVVLVIVALSIANAMSISVVERTREIGTLRAIGVRRAGVIRLFIAEALWLIALGCIGGIALMLLVRWGINAADIQYTPPGNSTTVPLRVGLDWLRTALAAVALALLGMIAACLPARRASRQLIIDALGHV